MRFSRGIKRIDRYEMTQNETITTYALISRHVHVAPPPNPPTQPNPTRTLPPALPLFRFPNIALNYHILHLLLVHVKIDLLA